MGIEKIVLPKGAVSHGWDWGNENVKIETLNATTYIHYKSKSVNDYRSIEIDHSHKKLIPYDTHPKMVPVEDVPRDFYSLVCALHTEITLGSPRNQYEQQWGLPKYNNTIHALTVAKEAMNGSISLPEKLQFSFPLPSGITSLSKAVRTSITNTNTHYVAEMAQRQIKIKGETVIVERNISLLLETDNSITATVRYTYNGEEKGSAEFKHVSNDSASVEKKLNLHFNQGGEDLFVGALLKE